MPRRHRHLVLLTLLPALLPQAARAAEQVTLRSGFSLLCTHHETLPEGDRVRCFTGAAGSYVDLAASSVTGYEPAPEPRAVIQTEPAREAVPSTFTTADLRTLLAHAGDTHRIDAELLSSVVAAESGGRVRAVSRTGARGLMQLMPATAAALGVHDSFAPADNVEGGTAYLDGLLTRYHDNIPLALAAYNAGPAAVDRYHGVPPYRETRAYVARIVADFNRRKTALLRAAAASPLALGAPAPSR